MISYSPGPDQTILKIGPANDMKISLQKDFTRRRIWVIDETAEGGTIIIEVLNSCAVS
jgi:hypothetical protein